MNNFYLIVRKSDNEIIGIENSKHCADKYNATYFDIVAWDIEQSDPPAMGSILSDSRTYAQKRQATYKLESDSLFQAYLASKEANDDQGQIDAAKSAWLAARAAIKVKFPKP